MVKDNDNQALREICSDAQKLVMRLEGHLDCEAVDWIGVHRLSERLIELAHAGLHKRKTIDGLEWARTHANGGGDPMHY